MIIYSLVFCGIALGTFTDLDNKQRKYNCWIILCCVFFAFYGLRSRVGSDWPIYENYYKSIVNDLTEVKRLNFEKGYYLINVLFNALYLPFQAIPFTISLIVCFFYNKAVKQINANRCLTLLVALYYLFFPTLEALRQAIPLFLFFYVLCTLCTERETTSKEKSLLNKIKQSLKFFSSAVFGGLFHYTALFVETIFYFFSRNICFKIVICAGFFSYKFLRNPLEELLRVYLPSVHNKYMIYTYMQAENIANDTFFSLKFVEYLILFFVLFFLKNRSKQEEMALNLIEFGMIMQISLIGSMSAVYRLLYYTDMGFILFFDAIDKRFEKVGARFLLRIITILFIGLHFYRSFPFNNELFKYHWIY